MSNTQARFHGLADAIERDRIASPPEVLPVARKGVEPTNQDQESKPVLPWEPWLTIVIGLSVMMIAVFF